MSIQIKCTTLGKNNTFILFVSIYNEMYAAYLYCSHRLREIVGKHRVRKANRHNWGRLLIQPTEFIHTLQRNLKIPFLRW